MTKATIEKQSGSEVKLKVIVTPDELQSAKAAVLTEAKKGLKVAGFRPGQAPDAMVERQLDPAKFQMDVVEKILAATFTEAVQGHNLRTLAQPKVDIQKFVPFDELEYTATVAILPEISLDYSKLKVKYDAPTLDEAEVAVALSNLQQQAAERTTVERPAKDGDEVRIDFEGTLAGELVEGAAAQNSMVVLGSGRMIPGFEEALTGLKKGDKKTFDVTFPKDYHATDLAGKKVTFDITLHEVREIKLPELTDAFAKEVANMASLDELKADIRQNLLQGREQEARKAYEAEVLAKAIDGAKLEISPLLESEQVAELENEYAEQVKSQGLEIKDWLKIQKKTEDEFKADLTTEARRRIGVGLIIRDIIDKQKLTVPVDEVETELERMRTSYTDPEVLKHLDHDHFKSDLANRIITQKAVDWLCDQAKGGK